MYFPHAAQLRCVTISRVADPTCVCAVYSPAMPLAPEAIIGIIALVLALPPVLMILWRWRKSTWRASLPVTESACTSASVHRAQCANENLGHLAPRHSWQLPLLPPSSSSFSSTTGTLQNQYPEARLHEQKDYFYVAVYQGSTLRYPEPNSNVQRNADRQWN